MRIDVFDESRRQWRDFNVVPAMRYQVRCRNGLHQFYVGMPRCGCEQFQRDELDDAEDRRLFHGASGPGGASDGA
jgi:hypothetical protein